MGFTQRFTGKISARSLWLGGSALMGQGARQSYSTAAVTGSLPIGTLGAEALQTINASSAISIFTMTDTPTPGEPKMLDLVVSSGVFVKAAPGTSFDPSTNTVLKSTYSMRVQLVGLSSNKWSIVNVFPMSTAGGAPLGGLTLSTTT
jgi:hypothetical protein